MVALNKEDLSNSISLESWPVSSVVATKRLVRKYELVNNSIFIPRLFTRAFSYVVQLLFKEKTRIPSGPLLSSPLTTLEKSFSI